MATRAFYGIAGIPSSNWPSIAPSWRWRTYCWNEEIMRHSMIHENLKKFIDGFHHDAHPMGVLISTVAALSTFYPDARNIGNAKDRRKQIVRLISKVPTLAAYAYRHRLALPYVYPDPELGYTKN